MYNVYLRNKVRKVVQKLPIWVQKKFAVLVKDIQEKGPEQSNWQNYSKLTQNKYHCHIGTSWVACWKHENNTSEMIEVYYVGSREKAPY